MTNKELEKKVQELEAKIIAREGGTTDNATPIAKLETEIAELEAAFDDESDKKKRAELVERIDACKRQVQRFADQAAKGHANDPSVMKPAPKA